MSTENDLMTQLRQAQMGLMKHPCEVCGKVFRLEKRLASHMKSHQIPELQMECWVNFFLFFVFNLFGQYFYPGVIKNLYKCYLN